MEKFEINEKLLDIWDMIHVLGLIFQAKFNETKISPVGWPREGQQALPHQGNDQVDDEVLIDVVRDVVEVHQDDSLWYLHE